MGFRRTLRRLRAAAVTLACAAAALTLGTDSGARPVVYPGVNGAVVYVDMGYVVLRVVTPQGWRRFRPTTSEPMRLPEWSPDGRRIAFTTNDSVYVVVPGGRLRRVVRGLRDVEGVSWSPDGTRLVYAAGGCSHIFVVGLNGKGVRRVDTGSPGCRNVGLPEWSPDGRSIAFLSRRRDTAELVVVPADGGPERRLAPIGVNVRPRWTRDSRSIAYWVADGYSDVDGPLRVVDVATARTSPVLAGLGDVGNFAWSPDGAQIVYVRHELTGLTGKIGQLLHAAAVDGSGDRLLTEGDEDDYPDWQPRCTIYGTDGADTLVGTDGDDVICGLRGDDDVDAGDGDDVVLGGDGADRIVGGRGSDRLFGAAGDDVIEAADGSADIVDGGPGDDRADADKPLDRSAGIERQR